MKNAAKTVCLFLAMLSLSVSAEEKVDLTAVHKIKAEALGNSKVMYHFFQLTDVTGPRLTGSPGFHAAAEWVIGRLQEYGIASAR